jgi:hypothetical protein
MTTLTDLSTEALAATRASLHAVAEHVMAATQYAHKRRIGLRQTTGGFATQPFMTDGVERRLAVVGTELVARDDRQGQATESRTPITTLRSAAALAGGTLGMPSDVYRPSPVPDPDAALGVDPGTATLLAQFYALVQAALTLFAGELAAESPSEIQLWPEHFDMATTISRVNYGGSPGDADHDMPYLYVGPFTPLAPNGFWNEPFGASRPLDDIASVDDALSFFREGRARTREHT